MCASKKIFLDALKIVIACFLLNRFFQHVGNFFFRRAHEMAYNCGKVNYICEQEMCAYKYIYELLNHYSCMICLNSMNRDRNSLA